MTSKLPAAPNPVTVLRGHKEAVNCLSFINKLKNENENELLLASGSADGQLIIWNIESRKPLISLNAHKHSIISLNILPNNSSSFASSSRDGTVKIWDTVKLNHNKFDAPITTLNTGAMHFCNSSCAKNKLNDNNNSNYDNLIATPSGNESEILLWDIRISKAVASIPFTGHGMLTSLHVNCSLNVDNNIDIVNTPQHLNKDNVEESNLNLLAGYEDGSMTLFDMKTLKPRHTTLTFHDGNPILAMDISNNGKYIMSGGADNSLNKMKINNNNLLSKDNIVIKETTHIPTPGTSCIRFRSDNRIVISGHWDHSIRIFDTKKLKPIAVLRYHRDSVFAVEFANITNNITNSNGNLNNNINDSNDTSGNIAPGMFATGSKDGTIAIWDVFCDKMK